MPEVRFTRGGVEYQISGAGSEEWYQDILKERERRYRLKELAAMAPELDLDGVERVLADSASAGTSLDDGWAKGTMAMLIARIRELEEQREDTAHHAKL